MEEIQSNKSENWRNEIDVRLVSRATKVLCLLDGDMMPRAIMQPRMR